MPRRPRVLVDGATYHGNCPHAHGARVFTAAEEAFELQVDTLDAELRRRLCMSGAMLNLSTTPDLAPIDLAPIPQGQAEASPGGCSPPEG